MKGIVLFIILIFGIGYSHGQVTPGSPNNFITVWTTLGTTSITIPTPTFTSGYYYDLFWEEVGNPSNNGNLFAQTGSATINGLNPGTNYRVEIEGIFPRIFFYFGAERLKLSEVSQWGNIVWSSMEFAFWGCSNMNVTATDVPNLSNVTNTANMFSACSSLNGSGANWSWNTANVTNMNNMFSGASVFNQNIGNWNTSNVTHLGGMFSGASVFNQPIGNWNTSNATIMAFMLEGASVFNQNIGNWNTNNVYNMAGMFQGASAFNQPIGNWNTSSVTDMSTMFMNASSFNEPIGNWNTNNVSSMAAMFQGASVFNQPIGNWNVNNVTNMLQMFANASAFDQPIGNWNTSNVLSMNVMFLGASSFNQNIGNWNTAGVVEMNQMFLDASAFNQNIANWNTSNVINMIGMFQGASAFNQPIGNWNTTNVTSMSNMFYNATAFNQIIGNWNTANVTSMSNMFLNASAFNQNIGNWNTTNVTSMSNMFLNASAFNQNIGNWNINNVTNMALILSYSGMDCFNYSQTLIGWAANSNTPNNISLGADAREFGTNALAAHDLLVNSKGWTISGDAATGTDCLIPPAPVGNSSQQLCIGGLISNISVSGTDIQWYSSPTGGSPISPGTPLVNGASYYASQTIGGHESIDRLEVNVTVTTLPIIDAGPNFSVCSGSSVTLSASGADSYNWTNGVLNGVSFVPIATTTYTVTGTNAIGCVNTDQITVLVDPLPAISAGPDQTVCSGTPVTLFAYGGSLYSWNNGVGHGVPFTPLSTQTYTVTGTNANGCTNTDQVVVNVNPLPGIDAGPDQTVCNGSSVILSASGGTSYSWNNGVTNGITFVPAGTQTYTVIGTDGYGCTNTDIIVVSVISITNTVTENGTTLTADQAGAQYTWVYCNDGNQPIFGATSQTYVVTSNDTYGVIIEQNGCSVISDCFTFTTLGLDDFKTDLFRVYPNPASTVINVEMENASTIRLFDVSGKLLKELNGASIYTIDVTDLTPGMYMIESAEGAKAKFIKE